MVYNSSTIRDVEAVVHYVSVRSLQSQLLFGVRDKMLSNPEKMREIFVSNTTIY